MASSNNLASLEPWTFRPSFPESWMSEAFSRDTEALTKALQKSLSSDSETLIESENSSFLNLAKPESIPTGSGSCSDPNSVSKHRNTISNGRISKRKSRTTKRTPTTFITADPSNFRQMVQQVTGIRFGNSHVSAAPVLKPEPQRPGNRIQSSYCLPTLDTSAFLLDNNRNHMQQVVGSTQTSQAHVSFSPVPESISTLEFDTFHSFPTLESWRVV